MLNRVFNNMARILCMVMMFTMGGLATAQAMDDPKPETEIKVTKLSNGNYEIRGVNNARGEARRLTLKKSDRREGQSEDDFIKEGVRKVNDDIGGSTGKVTLPDGKTHDLSTYLGLVDSLSRNGIIYMRLA